MDYEDESLSAAGLREVGEETDLNLDFCLSTFGFSTESFPEQKPPFRSVTVYLRARPYVQGAPLVKVREPDKCQLWAWIDPRAKDFGPVFEGIRNVWEEVNIASYEIRKGLV